MGLEDLTGASKFIDDLNNANPTSTDQKSQGDDHLRGIKNVLLNSFPNITGAVTSTQTELNILDGATLSTTELNYVDGVTSAIQTQLDNKAPLDSPALTGTPTAPTAATNTNTTQAATTAFVIGEIDSYAGGTSPAQKLHPSSALDDAITTDGSQSIGAGASFTPSQGLYNFSIATYGVLQLYISGAWRGNSSSNAEFNGLAFCDGTNMRITNNSAGTVTIWYQRFDG